MKTVAELTLVETSNIGEVQRATIKTSAKMFNFFSRQIYTDFFTAVWRELVSNGYDGQKVNGVVRPVVVTVPSMLEPYAKVRDFGCSMTHDFMMNQFMAFGDASTKENSNDFIGGFGIGSKAPLAYTEQYSIRCFLDGVVRVYSVFKDEEGCPSIAFLSEDTTDEDNGVEVGFPVRQDDIHKFTNTVVKTLEYFDPQPVLEGTDLKLEPIHYDAKGDKWGLRISAADRKPKLIIGGVAYPLDVSQIPYYGGYDTLRSFANLGLDIYLNIGDANIALSREQVTHDDELFKKLDDITKGIGEEFGKQMSKAFDSCQTAWEAKLKLADALEGADHGTANLFRKHAYWNGLQITPNITKPENFEVLHIAYGSFSWNSGCSGMVTTQAMSPKFRAWNTGGYFRPNSFSRIILDDAPDKPALRIRTVTEKFPTEKILFLRWNDPQAKPDWEGYLKALGSPPKSMIEKLSSYDPAKIVRASGGSVTRPFKCYVGSSEPYRNSSNHQSALPTGGGMYIVMDNFTSLSRRADINVAMQGNPANVVWLNKTDFNASGVEASKEWNDVEFYVQKVKDEYRAKHKNLANAEAWYRLSDGILNDLDSWSQLKNFPKQGPLFQLNKLRLEFAEVDTSDHSRVRTELLGVKFDDQLAKMEKLVEAARAKHPLLAEVADNHRYGRLSNNIINALF